MSDYGPTGGWADVDHSRWRRCLARCNMNYGNAVVLAAEELAPFGIERAEVVRHARWDAEREELHEARKAAVAQWRAEQREAERTKREALDDTMRAREVSARRNARNVSTNAGWRKRRDSRSGERRNDRRRRRR